MSLRVNKDSLYTADEYRARIATLEAERESWKSISESQVKILTECRDSITELEAEREQMRSLLRDVSEILPPEWCAELIKKTRAALAGEEKL